MKYWMRIILTSGQKFQLPEHAAVAAGSSYAAVAQQLGV